MVGLHSGHRPAGGLREIKAHLHAVVTETPLKEMLNHQVDKVYRDGREGENGQSGGSGLCLFKLSNINFILILRLTLSFFVCYG